MNDKIQTYDWFARMLSYPIAHTYSVQPNSNSELDIRPSMFDIHHSKISNNEYQMLNVEGHLEIFFAAISNLSLTDLEELYTRTFDINPVASLEIGWHLFGETYERGAFLVQMRSLLRLYNIEESSELPDHLTHTLMVVGRMPKSEADEFAAKRLLPSLDKIIEGFQGKENPYEHILLALKNFIEQEHLFDKSNCQQGVETNV